MGQIEDEQKWRNEIWAKLLARGGPNNTLPDLIRELGFYRGAAGIWADLKRTREIEPSGIAVGFLHTGSSYPDDICDSGVLYHYPTTQRLGHDESEIQVQRWRPN